LDNSSINREQFYSQWYSQDLSLSEPRLKQVMDLIRKSRAQNLLDIGCGDGSLSIAMKNALSASEVYGVEISTEAVEQAQERGLHATLVDVETSDLPFASNYFYAIFCGEIIEHLFDPDHLLDEVYRVLKPNGFFILTTPNIGSWLNRLVLLAGYQPYALTVSLEHCTVGKPFRIDSGLGREHTRFFTLRALKELLRLHHFEVDKVRGSRAIAPMSFPLPPLSFIATVLDRITSHFPSLATHIIVKAHKVPYQQQGE
jgi:ubiquinone/menaquinone biosynthesis C-methylase UbiE